MVKKNETYECIVCGYGTEGEGICRIGDDGTVVFVRGVIRGEKVKIKVVKVLKSYAYGIVEKIIVSSPERRKPQCDAFKKCGGCGLLHMSYDEQLRFKSEKMKDCLERIGGVNTEILPIIGAEHPDGYRNKVQLPVGQTANGNTVCGYFSERTHEIVEHNGCLTGSKISENVNKTIIEWMKEKRIPAYDEKNGRGIIRHIIVRNSDVTGQSMVVVVINRSKLPQKDALAERLKEIGITTACYNINTKKTNVITGDKTVCIYGTGEIEDVLCGQRFMISPRCFYQVNREQAEKLYETALSDAKISREDTVFDLYSGIGTISVSAAKYAGYVIGVEINEESVVQARKNAEINGIKNVEFLSGDAGEVTERLYNKGIKPDVIIVDPPRKGCGEQLLRLVVRLRPKRMVYVSCNPATLARDLKLLAEEGFETKSARAVDMFPHTSHVETVALLSRKKPDGHIGVKAELGEDEGKAPFDDIAEGNENLNRSNAHAL